MRALLRLVLREKGALEEFGLQDKLVSSELLAIECLRTLDRLRLQGHLSLEEDDAVGRRYRLPGTRWFDET